jgi:hypothetical protein
MPRPSKCSSLDIWQAGHIVELTVTQFSPVSCYPKFRPLTPSPFPSRSSTDNVSHSHQTSDSNTVLCVCFDLRFLCSSTERINNTVCGCYSRRHIYFPLPSKELCLSPIHCILPHISAHKLITCHLAQQINYFHSPPHRPYWLQHRPSPPNTPSYSLNALSKYCLSLVRFNDSVSSD